MYVCLSICLVMTRSVLKTVGVASGFVGCVDYVHVNSSQTSTVNFDLRAPADDSSSSNVLRTVDVGQLLSLTVYCQSVIIIYSFCSPNNDGNNKTIYRKTRTHADTQSDVAHGRMSVCQFVLS